MNSDYEEKKRKQFKRTFGEKYSLVLLDLTCWAERDGRILGEVSFCFGEQMTALEIRNVCEEISGWLGGDLYGTINLDFTGSSPSLEMMVELHDAVK